MLTQFSRTELLLGKEAMDRLKNARVAVFGIGGVGGYVCEALVRTGVGYFDLIDDDKVCLTNLNRQIIATRKTVGKFKVDVMKERMLEINPDVNVRIHKCFFLPENADEFPERMNLQICRQVDKGNLEIEIWERGSGYTKASGTGSCAAAAAAYKLGLVESRINVNQPGGMIQIDMEEDETIYMTGTVGYIADISVAESFFS